MATYWADMRDAKFSKLYSIFFSKIIRILTYNLTIKDKKKETMEEFMIDANWVSLDELHVRYLVVQKYL
jgi:hypothetical protein